MYISGIASARYCFWSDAVTLKTNLETYIYNAGLDSVQKAGAVNIHALAGVAKTQGGGK